MIEAARIRSKTPRIPEGDYVPHEVVGLHIDRDITYLRAWREYLGLTQAEVAERAGIIRPLFPKWNQARRSCARPPGKSWRRPWA